MNDAVESQGHEGNLICSRCRQETGNGNQGHFWSFCKSSRKYESLHFCCHEPYGCSLAASGPDRYPPAAPETNEAALTETPPGDTPPGA